MPSNRTITIAEMEYSADAAENLRCEVIKLRDIALKRGDFITAVLLSHTIAFMHVAIQEMYAN